MDNDIQITEVGDAEIVTSGSEHVEEYFNGLLASYDPNKHISTVDFGQTQTAAELDRTSIQSYASSAQTSVDTAAAIGRIVRKYANYSSILGLVVQAIANNINCEYKLSYDRFTSFNKTCRPTILKRARAVIDDFNNQINLEKFIYDSVLGTYLDGTFISLLQNRNGQYQVTNLPLGVAELSGYADNGNQIVLIDVNNLKSALQKTQKRNGRTPLFYASTEEEVKECFPEEVYEALQNRWSYAKLNPATTGVCTINAYGYTYGLTPIFRALNDILTLQVFEDADVASAKAASKRILFQKMAEDLLGPNKDRRGLDTAVHAHNELVAAWKNPTVVYTGVPGVAKLEYVEPKVTSLPQERINSYKSTILASLGVSFASDSTRTASAATINLNQLMRQINAISRNVERVIEHFYEYVLSANNISLEYVPHISVIDSEMLSADLKLELAKLLYTTFAVSRQTAMGILGINSEDEAEKRRLENEDGFDEVFKPYQTSYVLPSDNTGGRPATNDDTNQQVEDKARNDMK